MAGAHDDAGDRDAADDPFEDVTFDDAFVYGAPVREGSAEERVERWRHVEAEHRRIIEGARAHVREQAAASHRLAPSGEHHGNRGRWAVVVVGLLVIAFFWVRARETDRAVTGDATVGAVGGVGGVGAVGVDAVDDRPAANAVRIEGGQPPPGSGSGSAPLGRPAPVPTETGPYSFVATQRDGRTPVAYDPCRPIHVVVNPRTAPNGGDGVLREAIARVSEATGLQFVVDGTTSEAPVAARAPYQPERYPDRWAPVLIAWSDAGESPPLAGDTAGQGGSSWFELPSGSVFVSGTVVLDGPDLAELLRTQRGRPVARAIVQHELAHLVGLDHVDDPSQLMYPSTTEARTDFAAGDLRGLAALGTGRCFPEV